MYKDTRGFTVVELLVVIVVIGILAAITIVSFTGVQKHARDVSLQSDMKNASQTVELWLAKNGNSVASLLTLYATYGGGYSSWVVGEGADNALTTQLHWNTVPTLPKINVSPGTTIEIIGRYSGGIGDMTAVNDRMRTENLFCIAGAAPGSSYNYRPMSAIHVQYDRMLYYDAAYGKVMTMKELVALHNAGKKVTCEGHVLRWLSTQT